jgi:ribosomal protein L37AE/L43A
MDFEDQRSREIYPCYYCGNLTVTRSKKPRCSNPKCRRKVGDFLKQDNLLKCPYCKKYDMEFEKIGLWD